MKTNNPYHETIIRKGITRKKIPVTYVTQLVGGALSKLYKYFEVLLNIFEISRK